MSVSGSGNKSAETNINQCDHCEGSVEKQAIYTDGQAWYFYECQVCGCQWDTKGYRMTVGTHEECENQWVAMQHKAQNSISTVPRKVWIVVAVVVALMLIPFTGAIVMAFAVRLFLLLRIFIIPIAFGVLAYVLYRRWKKQNPD